MKTMKCFFKWTARRPVLVLVVIAGITLLAVMGIRSNIRMETNLDEYMPKDHPAFVYSDKADERFHIRDAILIAVEHPISVYNPETLEKIAAMEDDLARFEEIEASDIRSLHTADNIVGTEEGLDVQKFYTDVPITVEEAKAIGQLVRENTMVYGRLVSRDEKTTLVIVDLAKGQFSEELYNRILALTKKYQGPERLYVAGRPIVEGTMAILGPRDMARMGPLVHPDYKPGSYIDVGALLSFPNKTNHNAGDDSRVQAGKQRIFRQILLCRGIFRSIPDGRLVLE